MLNVIYHNVIYSNRSCILVDDVKEILFKQDNVVPMRRTVSQAHVQMVEQVGPAIARLDTREIIVRSVR